ncbi:flagellar hook-basal body complex protein FliE [Massilia sp. TSP1-1-2]|uniref:flagellar hook-basal body complex protein FliE n=1 Tax=Massilia sp. TSP1-1-2 TaxID=2804649 RepID=UPI003CECCEB9
MSIEGIGAIAPINAIDEPLLAASPVQPPAGGFAQWFAHEVGQVNDTLIAAQDGVQKLASGEAGNLHDLMIRMEEAKLSFQLLAQVRTRMLEAYQEIMRTQV